MLKKAAVITGFARALLIVGTLGTTDNTVIVSELYEISVTVRLIAGLMLVTFGSKWHRYLVELEQIRERNSIRDRRYIEEIKKSA